MAAFTRFLLTVILIARYIHLGELVVSLFSVVIGEDEKKSWSDSFVLTVACKYSHGLDNKHLSYYSVQYMIDFLLCTILHKCVVDALFIWSCSYFVFLVLYIYWLDVDKQFPCLLFLWVYAQVLILNLFVIRFQIW